MHNDVTRHCSPGFLMASINVLATSLMVAADSQRLVCWARNRFSLGIHLGGIVFIVSVCTCIVTSKSADF